MNANAGWDFLDDLRAHPFPVTVVIGDHDLVGFGGRLHRRQLSGLENVRLIVLEDAGHNAWVDRPRAFHDALVLGLERAAGRAPLHLPFRRHETRPPNPVDRGALTRGPRHPGLTLLCERSHHAPSA